MKARETEAAVATQPEVAPEGESVPDPASLELHPDRQAMLDAPETSTSRVHGHEQGQQEDVNGFRERSRKPKTSRYAKETEMAKQRQQEYEARSRVRDEREKERRAMTKARRPTKDGKLRLGRQSKVLLSRVQRLVAESKT